MCQTEAKEEAPAAINSESNEAPENSEAKQATGRSFTQVMACLTVACGNMSAGAAIGWSAGTLPGLQADPDFEMTTAATAWVASIVSLGTIGGSAMAGRIMDWLGRRRTLLVTAPIVMIGWVIIALSQNIPVLLVGRVVSGFAIAFFLTTGPVYCSETPEARLRGRLGLLPSLFLTFGVMLAYVGGVFFSWRNSCYVCSVPTIIMFLGLWIIPESQYWYLLKGKREEARASLRWLRGPHYDFSNEMADMEAKINSVGKKAEYRELLRPRTRRPFFISLFVSTSQQLSGASILLMYTGVIFASAGLENPQMAVIYTGIAQVVFTLVSIFMVDRLGRRPLIISSTFIIGVSCMILGVYYYQVNIAGVYWPPWVSLVTVLIAISGYCLGCRTLPWLLAAELFNTTIRSTANTATIFFNRILNLTVVQVYPFYEAALGSHAVFFTFGGLSLMCSLVCFLIVPETKGKTLEQIQEHFESKREKKKKKALYAGDPNADATNV